MIIGSIVVLFVLEILVAAYIYRIIRYSSKENKDETQISFKEAIDLLQLPIITFYNNNHRLHFILDTGANRSIINETVLPKCKYEETNLTANLSGLEGTEHHVSFIAMDIFYMDRKFSENFQVTDMSAVFNSMKKESGITIHGLLGSDFFRKYQYIIDFEKLTVRYKK